MHFDWDDKKNEVCHSYRQSDTVIRIISARAAARREGQNDRDRE